MNFPCLEAKTTCNFNGFMLKSFPWSVELYEGEKVGKRRFQGGSLFSRSEEQQLTPLFLSWTASCTLGCSLLIFSTLL